MCRVRFHALAYDLFRMFGRCTKPSHWGQVGAPFVSYRYRWLGIRL
jgi:hypothetical protein